MWPFDYFKKKPADVGGVPPAGEHLHHAHAPHPPAPVHLHTPQVHHTHTPVAVVPTAPTPKPHGKLRKYLVDPVPSKPRHSDEEDSIIPTMVGGFLVGEMLGSLTATPDTDSSSPAPASTDDTSTTGFQGFGGGESGGAGAGGSWDAPSSPDTSSSPDSSSSSDSGSSSSDSSGF